MTPLEDGSSREPEPTATDAAAPQPGAPQLSLVEEPRRYPSTIGGAIYLLVLILTGVALVIVALGHWRGGVHLLAGGIVGAAGARAVLPQRDAGMLEVRRRWFDVGLLVAVGVAMWVLATTIPAQG